MIVNVPVLVTIKTILLVLCILTWTTNSGADSYPYCGDCWCIPDENGIGNCPYWHPETEFSDIVINLYKSQISADYYRLTCNPYSDKSCTTTPPQVLLEETSAVCAYHYELDISTNETSCSIYSMKTYSSETDAISAGDIVTHTGSCGLCSTTQDLAIYLTEDFTTAGKICATQGLFDEAKGLSCYMSIGLTEECAKIWNYDGIYDGKVCGVTCAKTVSDPNNGPAPDCTLNPCLQCDEDKAGPVFTEFAGRTRRRSGLLSEIVRPCDTIAKISHNPCVNPTCQC